LKIFDEQILCGFACGHFMDLGEFARAGAMMKLVN
jgi:hypothetical protein